jgi:hypothetical protein
LARGGGFRKNGAKVWNNPTCRGIAPPGATPDASLSFPAWRAAGFRQKAAKSLEQPHASQTLAENFAEMSQILLFRISHFLRFFSAPSPVRTNGGKRRKLTMSGPARAHACHLLATFGDFWRPIGRHSAAPDNMPSGLRSKGDPLCVTLSPYRFR